MVPFVTLQPFTKAHLKLLAAWLKQPHVARWFPTPEEDLAWAMNLPAGGSQAIIASGAAEALNRHSGAAASESSDPHREVASGDHAGETGSSQYPGGGPSDESHF